MKSCIDCHYCKEDFDYDDFGNTVEYCQCVLTNDLIDCSEAEHCEDYEEQSYVHRRLS